MLVTLNVPATRAALMAAMEGLCHLNYVLLSRARLSGNPLPPLYRSGVRYKREQPGRERWLNVFELYEAGVGDCEDLAAARVAELRMAGIPALPWVKRTGARKYHAQVARPDDTIEDPSLILGMRRRRR